MLEVRGDSQLALAMEHAVRRRRAEALLHATGQRIAALDARLAAARQAGSAAARERGAEARLARRVADVEARAAATARERDRVGAELLAVRAAAAGLLHENQVRGAGGGWLRMKVGWPIYARWREREAGMRRWRAGACAGACADACGRACALLCGRCGTCCHGGGCLASSC